jgi:hypothetical protein
MILYRKSLPARTYTHTGAFRMDQRTSFTKCNEMTDGARSRTDCFAPTTRDS